MLNWEKLVETAPKWSGKIGHSKTVYFGPDPDAIFGRYWDGVAISEHPSADEISKYYAFWIALANTEQKEIIQAMFDTQIGINFEKAFKGKDAQTIVEGAIKWWDEYYHWEVQEFLRYLAWTKGRLRDAKGWDRTKSWKFKGSIPHRVKQFVVLANPELVRYDGKSQTKFEKIFFSVFTNAIVGGN